MKYTINSLAKLLGVSSNTIRRYTNMGYVMPEKNKENNYMYYDAFDINKLISVRMYRKFGFSHNEIKKIFESDVENIIDSFEKRLCIMDEELQKLKDLRHMFEANLIMIKRIEEFEKGFIEQNIEATYYIEYQNEQRLFKEKERVASIQDFMYTLPETKEVLIFKRKDVINNKFDYSFGIAAKKKDTDRFNVKINEYMKFIPVQKCVYFLLKTYFGCEEAAKRNSEIIKEKFEEAMKYLEDNNYVLDNDILGFNITYSVFDNQDYNYTLICFPVALK